LAVLALAAVCCVKGEGPGGARGADGVLVVTDGKHQASWVRNFNPFVAEPRWPTKAGIYEPLYVYNTVVDEYVPWLATEYRWSDGNRTLTFVTRSGVRWSDGRPFTARDVAFTFNLMRSHRALDVRSVWEFLAEVRAADDSTAEFRLKRPYTPSLYHIGMQPIVPEHVFGSVADPVTFANENPVATGPFTVVKTFQNQVYELGRNPDYWQLGKPYVKGVRLLALTGNDQATVALVNGEIDWAGIFIPDIERVYVAKDPAHHRYWFPPIGNMVVLYANTKHAPFGDERVRKALSMAIDRELVVKVALHGYTQAADATGLGPRYQKWKGGEIGPEGDWVRHDLQRAGQLLDEAGLRKGAGGVRSGSDGRPLRWEIDVVTGWSDWVSAVQIIARNLADLGIGASVRPYDYSAWFERGAKGEFDLSIGWARQGPTPYDFYRGQMARDTAKPVGQISVENWHRFASAEVDGILRQFEATADPAEQAQLARRLERLYVAHAPSIPLFMGPSWGEYNASRFSGFPDAEHPYARLAPPQDEPDPLLVLTTLKPK
jgi:peptide/nickel transport system substrate-binding protein